MFTGLVSDMGAVERLLPRQGGARLTLRPRHVSVDALALGESVACSGVCLTVVERGGGLVSFDAVPETLARTTLGEARPGTRVNLEADVVARHVARLREFSAGPGLSGDDLARWGFGGTQ